jgi:hypothetical protein
VVERLPDNLFGIPAVASPQTSAPDEPEEAPVNVVQMVLATVAHLKDTKTLAILLGDLPPEALALCDAQTWKKLFDAFDVQRLRPAMEAVLQLEPTDFRPGAFTLLAGLLRAGLGSEIRTLALRLAALPPRPPLPTWPRNSHAAPGDEHEITLMLQASRWITAPEDARKLADFLLGDRSLPYLREKLLPSIEGSSDIPPFGRGKPLNAPSLTVDAAIALFENEVARPITPYPDWTRPCPLPKKNHPAPSPLLSRTQSNSSLEDELKTFMADPQAREHTFARPQDERSVLEAWITSLPLDLEAQTVRSGRPHKLICTKNSASYDRAVLQRSEDLSHLARLRRCFE